MLAPVMLGFVGLGVDITLWQISWARQQAAAELASWAGSMEYRSSSSADNGRAWARAVAGQNGYVNGAGGATVTVNIPPSAGTHTTTSGAVEVVIAQPTTRWLTRLVYNSSPTQTTRAVVGSASLSTCMASLDSSNANTPLSMSGSGNVFNLSNCAYANNSSNAAAVNITGTNNSFTAASAKLAGNYSVLAGAGNSFCTTPAACNPLQTNTATSGSNPNDPYSSLTIPTSGTTLSPPTFVGSPPSATLTGGGKFTTAMSLTSGKNLTLSNGIYVFDKVGLTVQNSNLTLSNATIVFTATSGSTYGNFSVSGTSTLTLTAPTSGATSGVAIWMDRNAPSTNFVTIGGTVTMTQAGAIYAPSAQAKITGGVTGTCAQIIASQIVVTGSNSSLSYTSSCGSTGGSSGGGGGSSAIGFLE